jgi:inosine/xanthosine triphosphatase
MIIFVGSTNPVKLNATTVAASETWPEVSAIGYEVESQVSDQPMTDEETKTGAINRARAVLRKGLSDQKFDASEVLGVGLEGGVFIDGKGEMWTTVWAAVVDKDNQLFVANGARFPVPKIVADRIEQGKEMGPIMASFFNGRLVKKQEGMIGVVTKGFVDRTEEYMAIIKMALGQWYGRDWQRQLAAK